VTQTRQDENARDADERLAGALDRLRERELMKRDSIQAAIIAALGSRGVGELPATVAAELK
jgi:hypothetical protein